MRGSLSERCPAEILSEVQRRQVSGVLTFTHGGLIRQLSIDAGTMIRFATSSDPAENFTAHLSGSAGVDPDRMRQAMHERQGDELLGTTLVRLGHLQAADLVRVTREHVRRVVVLTLQMTEGTWEFATGALPFREQIDAGVRTAEVILEWSRLLTDLDWVRGRLGPDDRHIKRERRPPEGYQDIRLDSAEGYIMSRVDGATTAREIGMVSPMGDARTLAALLGLALSGLLERPMSILIELPEAAAAVAMPPASAAPAASVPSAASAPELPTPAASTLNSAAPRAAAAGYSSNAMTGTTGGPPSAKPGPPAAGAPAAGAPPLRLVTTPGSAPRPGSGKPGARSLRPGGKGMGRPGSGKPSLVPRRPMVPKPSAPVDSAELEREMLIRFAQMDSLDLYQALGVPRGAATDEVRRAYYALTRRFHPDKFRREDMKPSAEKVFARITEAYATLANTEARQRYDGEEASRHGNRQSDRPADTTDLARLNYRSGKEHLDRGKLAEALSFFANACQQDPTKSEYFEALGATQARNPRLRREAETNLNKAIELAPPSASPHVHMAGLYERSGATDKAIEMYRAALKWEPGNKAATEAIERLAPSKKGLLGGLFSRH